ncbi:MAG: peptidase M28 family protein, partial [Acidobacteriota bacterium]
MRATALALLTLFLSWLAGCDGGREQPAEKPATSADLPADAVEAARRIIDAARSDERALARLEALCDGIGHRHAGSPGLDAAISWALDELRQDGLDKVALEKVMVSVWERGEESLEMLSPGLPRRLAVLGLGRSVGTPAAGITAPVLVVPDFETLDRIGAEAAGKIVLYNFPMKTMENMFQAYGEAVQYRARAAEHASRHGALAALIRSVTTRSLRTPHTGAMKRYGDDMRPIPAAAISVEDAELLHRLQNRGERPLLRLFMGARTLPDQPSANVVAELRGRERPEQIVVIGGHLDTWDVGSGA